MPEQDNNRGNAKPQSNVTDAERRRRPGQLDEDLEGEDLDREKDELAGRDTGEEALDQEEAIDQDESDMEAGEEEAPRDKAGQSRQGSQNQSESEIED